MIYDSIDMVFDLDGDLAITENGDIMLTDFDVLIGIIQAIQNRLKYPALSWRQYPDVGVVELPIGEQNTIETAEAWEDLIYTSLTHDGMVDSSDLELMTAPLNESTIITLIRLNVHPTDSNGGRTNLNVYSVLDYNEQVARFY